VEKQEWVVYGHQKVASVIVNQIHIISYMIIVTSVCMRADEKYLGQNLL
jgi:hypothetical protein